jgi:malate synthase
MQDYVDRAGLKVAKPLAAFLEDQALPGTGIDAHTFWEGTRRILADLVPANRALLAVRDDLQRRIDSWHLERRGQKQDAEAYEAFLRSIGYLEPEPEPFEIETQNVDEDVARKAGPQLVVPVLNARFLLNAANARWGSLYDALYGTDAIAGSPPAGGYDSGRGAEVIRYAMAFLEETLPDWERVLNGGKHPLLVGWRGDSPLFRHNGLHIEIVVDRNQSVGRNDPHGLADILMESALTTIADLEDSVAAVDAEDKVAAYANWLGLMRGDLEASFTKDGRSVQRRLKEDRSYVGLDGGEFTLPGRSLMFVRNVGHLMTSPVILLPDGGEAPEGIIDAIVTSLIALHDLKGLGRFRNSHARSIYIVKPKMHGPEEARFTDRLFGAVEDLLSLPPHTIKVGLMDEERRTSANLAACIEGVKQRIVFINTGFLDRTGDEIHTSMQAGPMVSKAKMKESAWLKAYEQRNVSIGLACGFAARAQIGKGMWAAPDRMGEMLKEKVGHPLTGATTAWVPSPTAATLHALHYHRVDVFSLHEEKRKEAVPGLESLLAPPLADGQEWSAGDIRRELENNAQGILGYVVRWIEQGVGCSKVPDVNDIGLMEDRATLRISSQHISNWLLHRIVSEKEVEAALERMAAKVDAQNEGDASYRPMTPNLHASTAYQAARALVFEGVRQPNGYTEPLLHLFRKRAKDQRRGGAGLKTQAEPPLHLTPDSVAVVP